MVAKLWINQMSWLQAIMVIYNEASDSNFFFTQTISVSQLDMVFYHNGIHQTTLVSPLMVSSTMLSKARPG